jgi:hypothetical protein
MGTPYAVSSDLVSAYPAKSLAIAQYIDGYKLDTGPVQNAQTGTSYTFALTDTTKTVTANNAAASAYTIPPQSSVVWEDYTTLRILNLGAGVVTLTAGAGVTLNGTATVAQYSSATLVRTASNTWTIAGSGAAPGMVLITPTSVAGSGVTLSGGEVTFSAATTISVNGVFTATYDNYRMVWESSLTASEDALEIRMRLAGTDNSSSNYTYQWFYATGTSTDAFRATGQTKHRVSNVSVNRSFGVTDIGSPALAQRTAFVTNSTVDASTPAARFYVGAQTQATAFDGISLIPASSSMTGKLRIYGLRNS